jgi:hypothetical protein
MALFGTALALSSLRSGVYFARPNNSVPTVSKKKNSVPTTPYSQISGARSTQLKNSASHKFLGSGALRNRSIYLGKTTSYFCDPNDYNG